MIGCKQIRVRSSSVQMIITGFRRRACQVLDPTVLSTGCLWESLLMGVGMECFQVDQLLAPQYREELVRLDQHVGRKAEGSRQTIIVSATLSDKVTHSASAEILFQARSEIAQSMQHSDSADAGFGQQTNCLVGIMDMSRVQGFCFTNVAVSSN